MENDFPDKTNNWTLSKIIDKSILQLKINDVLVSEFSPPLDIELCKNDVNSDIFLQLETTCYPATYVQLDIFPCIRILIQACDDFEHRGRGWRLKHFLD